MKSLMTSEVKIEPQNIISGKGSIDSPFSRHNASSGDPLDVKRPKSEETETSEDLAKQWKKLQNAPKYNLNSEHVYCICRRPDHGGELMVGCDGCDEWYHFKCMKLEPRYSKLIYKFYCKYCEWRNIGVSRWKRKCRVPSCYEPIDNINQSKYCSEKCGMDFMRSKLLHTSGAEHKSSGLNSSDIKAVISYVNGNEDVYRAFVSLGTKFPELDEVKTFIETGSSMHLPVDVQKNLLDISEKSTNLNNTLKMYSIKSEYLSRTREKLKIINEKISNILGENDSTSSKSKSKSKKAKKYDVCGFDRNFNTAHDVWVQYFDANRQNIEKLIESSDIYEDFKDEINEIVQFYVNKESNGTLYKDSICLNDKRKCARHGGWWNLVNDDLARVIDELNSELHELKEQRDQVLKNFTIEKFESEV